jgi:hypothetical protein
MCLFLRFVHCKTSRWPYGNSGGVLKKRILAILLPDSQKYAIYDGMASFPQFQEKKGFFSARQKWAFSTK